MSAKDLADVLHARVKQIEAWERGVRPPYFQMPRLCDALETALCDEDDVRAWRLERILSHILLTLCIIPLLCGILAYPLIPAVFPLAVSGDGIVWGKSWYWILIGLGASVAAYGLVLTVLLGIRRDRARQIAAVALLPVLLAGIAVFIVAIAQYAAVAAREAYLPAKPEPMNYILAVLGACYTLLGVWAPMLRQNRILGIRCEGTLKNPAIWTMTHRAAFVHFQLCGIFCMLTCVFLPGTDGIIAFVVGTFTMILFPIFYATKLMLRFYPEMNAPRARKK